MVIAIASGSYADAAHIAHRLNLQRNEWRYLNTLPDAYALRKGLVLLNRDVLLANHPHGAALEQALTSRAALRYIVLATVDPSLYPPPYDPTTAPTLPLIG